MMKNIFLKRIVIAILFLPLLTSAQIFTSGFKNSLFTDCDNTTYGTGMTTFEINAASKRAGSNGFHKVFRQTNQKVNLFTLKNINWVYNETYRISFYYKAITPSDNSTTNIKVHASGDAKLTQFNLSLTSTDWVEYTSDYVADVDDTGGYVLFSIRPSHSGGGEFYFDDFLIEKVVFAPDFFGDLKSKDLASEETIKWEQFRPGMTGNNPSFYVHPTDPYTMNSSPNMGNSYRSTDKGLTFETILNENAASYKSGERGPIKTYSVDFASSDANFGFSTGKLKGDFRGLKRDLWEGGHHIPFIIKWPNQVKSGAISNNLISQVDIMATLLEITKTKIPEKAAIDSQSFLPIISRKSDGKPSRTSTIYNTQKGKYDV